MNFINAGVIENGAIQGETGGRYSEIGQMEYDEINGQDGVEVEVAINQVHDLDHQIKWEGYFGKLSDTVTVLS